MSSITAVESRGYPTNEALLLSKESAPNRALSPSPKAYEDPDLIKFICACSLIIGVAAAEGYLGVAERNEAREGTPCLFKTCNLVEYVFTKTIPALTFGIFIGTFTAFLGFFVDKGRPWTKSEEKATIISTGILFTAGFIAPVLLPTGQVIKYFIHR